MKNYILKVIAFFICASLHAQGVFFENINNQSGLPSENIYDIYKDSKGYIWCTSEIGLLRFNGKTFKLFDNDCSSSKSGSYLKEDAFGRIWYQSFDGYFFYTENNSLKQLPSHESSGFKSYAINSNSLFRVVDHGIEQIDLNTLEQRILIKGNNFVFCQILGDWLYYGDKTVYRYHLKKKSSEKIISLEDEFKSLITFSNEQFIAIADRSNSKTPFILLNTSGIVTQNALALPETLQNVYLQKDEIWCLTKNGIYRLDYNLQPKADFHFLSGKNVSGYTKDSNNFIWISSPTNGIYVIKDLLSKEFSLTDDEFSSISQKNGVLYTGTNSGKIYQHLPNLETTLYFDTHENNHILFLDFNSFPDWNFFTGNGFYAQDITNNKVYRNYTSVKDIIKINDTLVGIASTGYAGKVDLTTIINEEVNRSNTIENLRAKSCAYSPKEQTLFVATNKGLFSIDKQNTVKEVRYNDQDLFAKKIAFANDTLWGITNNGKAFYHTQNNLSFLNDKIVFKNIKTYKNHFYLSSGTAIFRLKRDKLQKLNSIGSFYNIIDFEIVGNTLFLVTNKKLIQIPLENHIQFKELPQININIITFNEQIFPKSEFNAIPYDHNSVSLYFDIVNFDYLNEYDFYYYLNGKAFQFDSNTESVILPELQSDHYVIGFKIFDRKTNTSVFSTEAEPFTILLPFWKRWWFVSLIVIFIFVIIYCIYRIKLHQITKKNKAKVAQLTLENNLKESRLQLIKSQMNPHFFFNAINNIQSYIFTNETKEASQYLSKFSKLTRKILEFSEANTISLKEEIESLQLYLELQQMRFKDLHFAIDTHNIYHSEHIKIPTMMYQPYVENAILHGLSHSLKTKELHIDFSLENQNTLIGIITDNGIGRVKSAELNSLNTNKPKSFATKANLERIQLLNKNQYKITVDYVDLYNDAGESNGTRVTIKIEL
ncbi:sensor histidine kinase [Flavobacterium sp. NRK F10]|uniref:sensor histidine kinase n=1 Tax=Flavobacterium sp. NRK F10 TaxID=2954931 RepID=UPI0020905839|nr:sensor histidine kinase [Flavobacterium sp. NRK F10]MCO6173680.1 sensor histidine kinase [Flavobacterium sp. NRK F10]